MFVLACLTGCSFFDQDTETFTSSRVRPVSYGSRLSAVALGRVPSSQMSPADLAMQESMERRPQGYQRPDGGLYDNYTISVSPPPVAATGTGPSSAPRESGVEPGPSPSTRSNPPPVASHSEEPAPIAKPVPGKQGYVFSPFSPNAGYIDVTGMTPGTEAKDPYTGKVFRVP